MDLRARAGSRPRPEVEFACGSRSTSRIGWPSSANAAPRLIAVVVLPTPPFWLTTAITATPVPGNILWSLSMADPICSAMRRDCSPPGPVCLARLLRFCASRNGHRSGSPPARPQCEARHGGEHHLRRDRQADQIADTDGDDQVVGRVTDARSGGVGVLADESEAQPQHENGEGVERDAVLAVNRGEQERGQNKSKPRLKRASEEDLLADCRQQSQ